MYVIQGHDILCIKNRREKMCCYDISVCSLKVGIQILDTRMRIHIYIYVCTYYIHIYMYIYSTGRVFGYPKQWMGKNATMAFHHWRNDVSASSRRTFESARAVPPCPGNRTKEQQIKRLFYAMDWFKGNFTGKPMKTPYLMEKSMVPVDFPLNQSIMSILGAH